MKQFRTDTNDQYSLCIPKIDIFEERIEKISELACSLRNELEELQEELSEYDCFIAYDDEDGNEHTLHPYDAEYYASDVSDIEDFFFSE